MRNDFDELYEYIPMRKLTERFVNNGDRIDCTIEELLEGAKKNYELSEKIYGQILKREELKERLSEDEYGKSLENARNAIARDIYWINELKKLNKDVVITFRFKTNKGGE